MYPDPKRILQIGGGALYIMGKPAGFENLRDDILHLSRNGITHIVSLLEVSEADELGLANEETLSGDLDITYRQIPVQDRSTPESVQDFISLVSESHAHILEGAHLVAHCRAGIGRSGIFTTAVLIKHGLTVDEAFEAVSVARGFRIPDTQSQIDWIHTHASSIAA